MIGGLFGSGLAWPFWQSDVLSSFLSRGLDAQGQAAAMRIQLAAQHQQFNNAYNQLAALGNLQASEVQRLAPLPDYQRFVPARPVERDCVGCGAPRRAGDCEYCGRP